MLLKCRAGFVEVVVGDSFEFGPGRWRVCGFYLNEVYPTPEAMNGTVTVICSIYEGEIDERALPFMVHGKAKFTGDTVALLRYLDDLHERSMTD